MAYLVPRNGGTWEIRESVASARGPRSHTLATFRVLTPEVIGRAIERATKPLCGRNLRQAAARAGAPIAPDAPDRAAGELLAELAHGRQPRGVLRRLLLTALGDETGGPAPTDNARAAGAWIAATPAERGEALRDLLLLSDRLPATRAVSRPRFPRIRTAAV
jgi:hypothetical protein